jgi:single-strand DNA-binding protein
MNNCIFTGRLVADPELRQTPSNVSVCRFRIAVNRSYKEADGSTKADFIQVTSWRAQAEFVSKYFSKGSAIIVRGEMRNADYTDSNGVKHYAMECVADKIEFGESKSKQSGSSEPSANGENVIIGDLDDFEEILSGGDVPF